jgi:hypothetical protein
MYTLIVPPYSKYWSEDGLVTPKKEAKVKGKAHPISGHEGPEVE